MRGFALIVQIDQIRIKSVFAWPIVLSNLEDDDDRWRNAPDVFRKTSDLYRVDTETAEVNADFDGTKFLKSIMPLLP